MGLISRYGKGQEPDKEGTVTFADFMLGGQWFAAMDSAQEHKFAFNEAISFLVQCDTQEEIDYYWDKLTDGGQEVQCGWLKDKFGVSWQVVPTIITKMLTSPDQDKVDRVTKAFLQMKKFFLCLVLAATVMFILNSCAATKRDCNGVRHVKQKGGFYL